VGSGEGKIYANLTSTKRVEQQFHEDPIVQFKQLTPKRAAIIRMLLVIHARVC